MVNQGKITEIKSCNFDKYYHIKSLHWIALMYWIQRKEGN